MPDETALPMTPATAAAPSWPTTIGTSVQPGASTRCRKGSCTSRQCSRAWAASLTATVEGNSETSRSTSAVSMVTLPSGVCHDCALEAAIPFTGTKWDGPMSTTTSPL